MTQTQLKKYCNSMHINLTAEDLRVNGNEPFSIGDEHCFLLACKSTEAEVFILGIYNETKNPANLYKLARTAFSKFKDSGYTRVITTVEENYSPSFAKAFGFQFQFSLYAKEL